MELARTARSTLWGRQSSLPPQLVYENYLGGKGLGIHLLVKENPAGVEPLSPENRLIFALGPITDSRIYGSCRHGVFAKSPRPGSFRNPIPGGKVADKVYCILFA